MKAEDRSVAFIGLGGISRGHTRAIEKCGGLELVAVCDTNTEVLAKAQLAEGVPTPMHGACWRKHGRILWRFSQAIAAMPR